MADELDYYALLQVPHDADIATVRLAFRRLARMYHPDVAGSGSLAHDATAECRLSCPV